MGKKFSLPKSNNPNGKPPTWTVEKIELLADEMIKFFEQNPTAKIPATWLKSKKLHRKHIQRFREKSPIFDDAYQIVIDGFCTDRIFSGAADGTMSHAAGNFALAVVCGWKKEETLNVDQKVTGEITHVHKVDFEKIQHLFNQKEITK